MSKYTTYLKSSDGYLVGSTGDNLSSSVATLTTGNSSDFPDAMLNAMDGGSIVLCQSARLIPDGAAGTVWMKLPPYVQVLSIAVDDVGTVASGDLDVYVETASKVSTLVINDTLPITTFGYQLDVAVPLLKNTSTNIVLRLDVSSLVATVGQTPLFDFTVTYRVIPQADAVVTP